MTHFQNCVSAWINAESSMLQCGHEGVLAVDEEGKTIRDISKAICGNYGLEDRLGRYIMAARWDTLIFTHPIYKALYEDMRDWLSVSHYAELWKNYQIAEDKEDIFDLFEQCFVRNVRKEVTEVRPVDWLRGRAKNSDGYSLPELFQRVWTWAAKTLPDLLGELSRQGLQADKRTKRRVRILKLVLREFEAEKE